MELCTPVSDLLVRGRFSGGVPLGDTSGAVCAASQSWLSGKRCSCLVTLGSSGHGGVRRGWDDWRGEHGNIYCCYVKEAAGGNLLSDAGSSPRSVTAQGVRWGGGGRQAQRGAPCAPKAASC